MIQIDNTVHNRIKNVGMFVMLSAIEHLDE